MWSIAHWPQNRWLSLAWQGRVLSVRSLKKSSPISPTAASAGWANASMALITRSLYRVVLVVFGVRRGEELGDDLDREDAGDHAAAVDHGGVLDAGLEQ